MSVPAARRQGAGSLCAPSPAERATQTAAHHLVSGLLRAHPAEAVGSVVARLRQGPYDALDTVFVVDERDRLIGLVALTTLLAQPDDRLTGELATAPPIRARLDEDQERVASAAIAADVTLVPVTDGEGRLIGAVPSQALIDILRHEHVEDLQRFVGIQVPDNPILALEAPPLSQARQRLPWLVAGLIGSALATLLVARFEQALETQIAIAFFVPGIVYLADAIGTQTEAIAVRGLSFNLVRSLTRLLGHELATGLLIGGALAAMSLPAVWLAFGEIRLAAAVSLSIVAAGTAATTIGMLLPWVLSRFGMDPALGAGPLATIIQDVLSLLVYFTVVVLLVLP